MSGETGIEDGAQSEVTGVNRPSHTRRASLCALASSRYSRVDRLLLTFRVFRYTVPIGTISQPMHIYAPPPLIIQQQASYSRQLVSPAPACAASSAGGGGALYVPKAPHVAALPEE